MGSSQKNFKELELEITDKKNAKICVCKEGLLVKTVTSALRSQSLIHVLDKIDGCFIEPEEKACPKELLA